MDDASTDSVELCFYSLKFCCSISGGQKLETLCTQGFVSLSVLTSFPKNKGKWGASCPVLQPRLLEWWDSAAFFPLLMLKERGLHLVWCSSQTMCSSSAAHKRVINISSHCCRKEHSRLAGITLLKQFITWSYLPILRMLIEVCSLEEAS